ncbi:hypothetical protein WICPIJ_006353 [Wickerhamomyces pijperi]|uniref:Uncharacterized protein n=1 Tax=Wickerhamomyces pijperi TaxID=599730 RepID=A0A9P8Q466_WICPI|nr:hypothetical protein WICPIJ_006353 [Wickerhamomyces pijperi]
MGSQGMVCNDWNVWVRVQKTLIGHRNLEDTAVISQSRSKSLNRRMRPQQHRWDDDLLFEVFLDIFRVNFPRLTGSGVDTYTFVTFRYQQMHQQPIPTPQISELKLLFCRIDLRPQLYEEGSNGDIFKHMLTRISGLDPVIN